jgi:hypothetical protein
MTFATLPIHGGQVVLNVTEAPVTRAFQDVGSSDHHLSIAAIGIDIPSPACMAADDMSLPDLGDVVRRMYPHAAEMLNALHPANAIQFRSL